MLSCNNDDPKGTISYPVSFAFTQTVGGGQLMTNSLNYTNAAGNTFSVEKLQYIISDVTLHKKGGGSTIIDEYHFVDIANASTLTFNAGILLEEGIYDRLSFVFGLKEDKNISGVHTDLNALSWSWPDALGGGYHFMKLEGRYIDTLANTSSYTTHMGTAREITAVDTTFHVNYIHIDLSNVEINISSETTIDIEMDVLNWYENPYTWDFNLLNTMIMPNYEAQINLRNNGQNVFSIGQVHSN
ncbi:MAG: hypothetical protein OEW67_13145 [Cyclobacteriaceae bacterium]|nr:hypothetical protein [Cyclobacteriaceae bacterium]